MGDFFAELIDAAPSYSLKIYCEYAARLLDRLQQGQLDVAIMPCDLNRSEGGIIREMLFRDRLAIFVGQQDPLSRQSGVLPSALRDHHWIAVGAISGLFDVTRDVLGSLGLTEVAMTFRMLERTRSCSMLPYRLLGTYQDRYRIAPLDLTVELPGRNLGFWMAEAVQDRPECVDFRKRLSSFLLKSGLA